MAGSGIGWAAAIVFSPADDVLDASAFTYVAVVDGEVGSSISLNTTVEWTPVPAGSNLASGVVTSVDVAAGEEVSTGDVLYTVNLRPVTIAAGAVPAFRALNEGSDGADVAQLQSMLTALNFYSGAVDGEFGAGTRSAVTVWQESLGTEEDGIVEAGDIIFVPSLPARVTLDTDTVVRGALLGGGEAVVQGLPQSPAFTVAVTSAQAALVPTGTRVEITGPEGDPWVGFVVDQSATDQDGVTIELAGTDDARICADRCDTIPVTGPVLLKSRIVTVEPVTGLTVPSAALLTKADGTIAVIDKNEVEHAVSIITSARGMSVIVGVQSNLMVRVPVNRG